METRSVESRLLLETRASLPKEDKGSYGSKLGLIERNDRTQGTGTHSLCRKVIELESSCIECLLASDSECESLGMHGNAAAAGEWFAVHATNKSCCSCNSKFRSTPDDCFIGSTHLMRMVNSIWSWFFAKSSSSINLFHPDPPTWSKLFSLR